MTHGWEGAGGRTRAARLLWAWRELSSHGDWHLSPLAGWQVRTEKRDDQLPHPFFIFPVSSLFLASAFPIHTLSGFSLTPPRTPSLSLCSSPFSAAACLRSGRGKEKNREHVRHAPAYLSDITARRNPDMTQVPSVAAKPDKVSINAKLCSHKTACAS